MVRLGIVRHGIQFATLLSGEFAEQSPRGLVLGGDGGLQARHIRAERPVQDRLQHQAAKPQPTRVFRNGDLPDEQRVGRVWHDIGRDPAHGLTRDFRQHTGVGEMITLQHVAIHRVLIKWTAGPDQFPNRSAVFGTGESQGRCGRLQGVSGVLHVTKLLSLREAK